MNLSDNFFLENNPIFSGKIRQVYNYSADLLLIKTSDKISAYDFVFDDEITGKGQLLTKISKFWFLKTANIIENHFISDKEIQNEFPKSHLACMLVKKCEPIKIEAIVRGYLCGSAYEEYLKFGTVAGHELETGLKKNSKLQYPIFTPSSKAPVGGKDENISYSDVVSLIGEDKASYIKEKSIQLYEFAHHFALQRGLSLLDTKFEFGIDLSGKIVLIDEIFTPDCSRYCKTSISDQEYLDKQYFRDYLKEINWNNEQIKIPDDIKRKILSRYQEVYKLITNV